MIVGAIVGIAVQLGIESTGLLGPSLDALLQEQQSNFEEVNTRLDKLKASSHDPALTEELVQLGKLIKRQDELRQQAGLELAFLGEQVATLKQQALDDQGFSAGADFWLKPGESVSVGDDQHVLGVVRKWTTAVDVILNGKKSRLSVGDALNTDACTVFFKQSLARSDGRVGFDLSCS
jgi:chromosome segregation ATPase